ncbi:hypothetical protein SAMN04488063_2349 [Halopelagius inordinatus]|uniref:Uncharacterized protein n=1 Tax=Halopelagius inordinatus TaxID=553467 RepID=A0A1I2SVG5_9EURY|nr:hypothetical protein SAMN04488063_2349 [Halopelagius inordinatus]
MRPYNRSILASLVIIIINFISEFIYILAKILQVRLRGDSTVVSDEGHYLYYSFILITEVA